MQNAIPELNQLLSTAGSSNVIRSYAEQWNTEETFRLSYDKHPQNGRMLMLSASALDRSQPIDVSWLPFCAEKYNISADIRDYVIAEVPIVEGDIPNRNMHCFLTSRLVEYIPDLGMQAYKTFVGKPTFYEHQHDDHTKAKGVIFDAQMRVVNGRAFTMILKGFDRTKDPKLANDVLTGRRKGHSMSAWTTNFDCAHCGHRWNTSYISACACVKGPQHRRIPNRYVGLGSVLNGGLVYAATHDFRFFESSSVGDQANHIAEQTQQVTIK